MENLKLMPHQLKALEFAVSRKNSYLALDPGLGKTAVAVRLAERLLVNPHYVCPPFLVRNVELEFEKFTTNTTVRPTVIPDTMLHRFSAPSPRYTLLIIDEAHRFKNPKARRTKLLLRLAKGFNRIVCMSGTPMPNGPIELHTLLSAFAPETINHRNRFDYGLKYCAGHRTRFGWDFSGASNMKELAQKVIGSYIIRFKKDEVLKDLPPKTENMVIIGENLSPKLSALDSKILKEHSPEDLMKGIIKLKLETSSLHLATYRRALGEEKVKASVKYLKYLLSESNEKILVFAHHRKVVAELHSELKAFLPMVITGDTPMHLRQSYVDTFQKHPPCRLFIGNITAMGLGLTLTAATRVVFVEFSWLDSENQQASDRCHRIGQKSNVLVDYLVFKNSVDRSVLEACLRKRKISEKFHGG